MSDKPTRSGGGSGLATLPEWPEEPKGSAIFSDNVWSHYHNDVAEAALARLEALVEYAEHPGSCNRWSHHEGGSNYSQHRACDCGLSELLAACERRKS